MIVAIHQPNYLPWLGYFRKLVRSDTFVFYDNVQMPRGKSFTSRSAVKTPSGRQWLTVPVGGKSDLLTIKDVEIADQRWVRKHLRTLSLGYAFSPWKEWLKDGLEPVLAGEHRYLADLNITLIRAVLEFLGKSDVRLLRASEMELRETGADTVEEILVQLGTSLYLTGQGKGTQRHLDEQGLGAKGIEVAYVSADFPQYEQRHGEFEEGLSIVDALLNCGPERTLDMLLQGD
jgi:hypothetical protein